jgi:hypothetical protein
VNGKAGRDYRHIVDGKDKKAIKKEIKTENETDSN